MASIPQDDSSERYVQTYLPGDGKTYDNYGKALETFGLHVDRMRGHSLVSNLTPQFEFLSRWVRGTEFVSAVYVNIAKPEWSLQPTPVYIVFRAIEDLSGEPRITIIGLHEDVMEIGRLLGIRKSQ